MGEGDRGGWDEVRGWEKGARGVGLLEGYLVGGEVLRPATKCNLHFLAPPVSRSHHCPPSFLDRYTPPSSAPPTHLCLLEACHDAKGTLHCLTPCPPHSHTHTMPPPLPPPPRTPCSLPPPLTHTCACWKAVMMRRAHCAVLNKTSPWSFMPWITYSAQHSTQHTLWLECPLHSTAQRARGHTHTHARTHAHTHTHTHTHRCREHPAPPQPFVRSHRVGHCSPPQRHGKVNTPTHLMSHESYTPRES